MSVVRNHFWEMVLAARTLTQLTLANPGGDGLLWLACFKLAPLIEPCVSWSVIHHRVWVEKRCQLTLRNLPLVVIID